MYLTVKLQAVEMAQSVWGPKTDDLISNLQHIHKKPGTVVHTFIIATLGRQS